LNGLERVNGDGMVKIPSTMITEKLEGRNIYLVLVCGESLERCCH